MYFCLYTYTNLDGYTDMNNSLLVLHYIWYTQGEKGFKNIDMELVKNNNL